MYRDSIVNKFFIIVIYIGVRIIICASDDSHPELPGNDYVLRSCMSSVELSRRNVDVPKSKLPFASQRFHGLTANLPATQSSLSRNRVKPIETRGKSRQKFQQRSILRRRPAREMIADTPLTTLNVERRGRNDDPKLFMKNDLLPEIQSSKSDVENDKNEASIIVIESAASRITSGR